VLADLHLCNWRPNFGHRETASGQRWRLRSWPASERKLRPGEVYLCPFASPWVRLPLSRFLLSGTVLADVRTTSVTGNCVLIYGLEPDVLISAQILVQLRVLVIVVSVLVSGMCL